VKGLEEEVSETSANLKDVITTNDGLNQQVVQLENTIKVLQEACKCVFLNVCTLIVHVLCSLQISLTRRYIQVLQYYLYLK